MLSKYRTSGEFAITAQIHRKHPIFQFNNAHIAEWVSRLVFAVRFQGTFSMEKVQLEQLTASDNQMHVNPKWARTASRTHRAHHSVISVLRKEIEFLVNLSLHKSKYMARPVQRKQMECLRFSLSSHSLAFPVIELWTWVWMRDEAAYFFPVVKSFRRRILFEFGWRFFFALRLWFEENLSRMKCIRCMVDFR